MQQVDVAQNLQVTDFTDTTDTTDTTDIADTTGSGSRRMQLQAQGSGHLQNCRKTRVTVGAQRTVAAFMAQPSVFGHLSHSLGAHNVSKRFGNASCIVGRAFCPSSLENDRASVQRQ